MFGNVQSLGSNRHPFAPVNHPASGKALSRVGRGTLYKFHIRSRNHGAVLIKTDPFARLNEVPPKSASIVWDLNYTWHDHDWMQSRARHNALNAPISIYEVHLGSWMRVPGDGNRS